MNRMLISKTAEGELRIALLRDHVLYDIDVERSGTQKKGNIYLGVVEHIEPSLEAAFVNYGAVRHGFLPIKEVARSYFPAALSEKIGDFSYPHIQDVLRPGQQLLVEIDKDERGSKGAALTTRPSLPGTYLVLMPNSPSAGGISKRIEGQSRDNVREMKSRLNIPEGMGVIIRTAGMGKSLEELQWDLDALLRLWDNIVKASQECTAPCLIYQENDFVGRAIRDYLRPEIQEIIVDDLDILDKTKLHLSGVRPEFLERVKLYQGKVSLFSFYKIEHQIETAYQRIVRLPSGGSIVIDPTEALVSIDVNSSRATGGGDIEETALNTNLEAADEVARQIRLRDIGGLIVIDFIDMTPMRNQREVGDRLREALKFDRARVQVGNITRFGLLEMSRQRLRPSLSESSRMVCPRCDGQGSIRGIESLSLSILRILDEEAAKEDTAEVRAQLPVDLATFMLNEKRQAVAEMEKRFEVRIFLLPNDNFETPNYTIKRIRRGESGSKNEASYKLFERQEVVMPEAKVPLAKIKEAPVISAADMLPKNKPLEGAHSSSKIKSFFGKIFGKDKDGKDVEAGQDKIIEAPASSVAVSVVAVEPKDGREQSRSYQQKRRQKFSGRSNPRSSVRRGSRGGRNRFVRRDDNANRGERADLSSAEYPEIGAVRASIDEEFSIIRKNQAERGIQVQPAVNVDAKPEGYLPIRQEKPKEVRAENIASQDKREEQQGNSSD